MLMGRRNQTSWARRSSRGHRLLHVERLEDRRLLADAPELLRDIIVGRDGSYAEEFVEASGLVFFRASDGLHGEELWRTDGTTEGTILVKDIFPGSSSSEPQHLISINGTLYFRADDGVHGAGLWKSDGTADGTVLVKDTAPGHGYTGPLPDHLTNVNGTLYFRGHEGGQKLWKSDGTTGGTVMVSNIDADYSGSMPDQWLVVNDRLYFSGNDGVHGRELYRTDGTADGTVLVKDIHPGIGVLSSSSPDFLTNVNGTLFFSANDGTHGEELWKTDGTPEGTVMVKDLVPGIDFSEPQLLTNVNGILFFRAHDNTHGWELWKSDGTEAGTVMVKDIRPGLAFSEPEFLTNIDGTLYFRANDGIRGYALWKSDGTADGTVMVKESSFTHNPINVNGSLYFISGGIWKSDGTTAGTVRVSGVPVVPTFPEPPLVYIGGTFYFVVDEGATGREPWLYRPFDVVAANDAATVNEDSTNNSINVLVNDSGPPARTLAIASVTQSAHGVVTVGSNGLSIVYAPNADFAGVDTFSYTVSDGMGVASATVTVTVVKVGSDFKGSPGDDAYFVRRDSSGANVQVFDNVTGVGMPIFSRPFAALNSLTFETLGGDDRLIIDLANGSPLPIGGIHLFGGSNGPQGDRVSVRDTGTTNGAYIASATTTGSGTITIGARNVTFSGLEPVEIAGFSTFTVITPNANDALSITNPVTGVMQLAGSSGVIALSPLSITNVGTVIVDAAMHDSGGGSDTLTISTTGVVPNSLSFLVYRSGTGANTLTIDAGTARIDSTVAAGGELNTNVAMGGRLVTHRLRQTGLSLAAGGGATILPDGTDVGTSVLNRLTINTGATLDINDNAVIVDYTADSPVATIRTRTLEGRGGSGIGNGQWIGTGITSGRAMQANATAPDSHSVGYAENAALPLGAYTSFRGVAVDVTAVLIAYTRTGDANLDGAGE